MSFKNSSLDSLAAMVLPIVYFASLLSFYLLRADDIEGAFTEDTDPVAELSISRSDTTVALGTSDVEIAFAIDVPNYHVGIEYLKNLTDTITIDYDQSKHLWTIALLYPNSDTTNPMEADSNLYYITFDDSTIACDTLTYFLRNDYPDTNDKSLILNWVGVIDTTNFPNDTLNVDVLATILCG